MLILEKLTMRYKDAHRNIWEGGFILISFLHFSAPFCCGECRVNIEHGNLEVLFRPTSAVHTEHLLNTHVHGGCDLKGHIMSLKRT